MNDKTALVFPPPEPVTLEVAGSSARFPVRRIYCVGLNYVAHIREMGADEDRNPPIFFQKPADSIVADGATIPYPTMTNNYHYELELVVALKSGGYFVPQERALQHIYGYGVGLDMTRRTVEGFESNSILPWEVKKSFDQSCPCGPIRPVAAVGHIDSGRIRLEVNGETKQNSDLGLMIWKVPEIISRLSRHFALAAGDLILTGTPNGVGPVGPGDTLVGSIEKLGTLRVTIGPAVTATPRQARPAMERSAAEPA
jgi:fumarylpyruvate hydrolase